MDAYGGLLLATTWCFLQCSMSGTGTTIVLVATTTISNACSTGSRISSSIGSCQQFQLGHGAGNLHTHTVVF